jgi:signal peptide peptidase SppA
MNNPQPARQLSRVASLVFATPWAMREDYVEIVSEVVERHVAGGTLPAFEPEAAADPARAGGKTRPVEVVNGVAIVPVVGVLARRVSVFAEMSGATSLQAIAAQFNSAIADPNVVAVALHIDSPGGQALGIPEMADAIFNARSSAKPVVALFDGLGASAAYWLGSQADQVFATRGASVGSIGVIARLQDSSRAEKNAGIDSLVIRSGKNKAIGVGPVSDDQAKVLQASVERLFATFVADVERGRGITLSEDAKTGKEFFASDAVAAGLVDGIKTLAQIVKEYGRPQNA